MNESINLKWNNYSLTFLKTLRKFQNKESLCDSTLTCHGKFYPVHRLVLSLCSEYFEDIFEKTPCKHPFLIINDIEPIHLEALLNFIYQGEVQVSQENLPKFIKAAEYLKIKGLISEANSVKNNMIYNSYNNFDIYPGKSERVLNEDRKPNVRLNNVSYRSKNKPVMSPVILDPIIPIVKLTGCVYDSLLPDYNFQKTTKKIKKEKEFSSISYKNKKQKKVVKYDRVKANPKKPKVTKCDSHRMSPRKMKPMVNYYIPDNMQSDFDCEEILPPNNDNLNFIGEDLMPQITISSYSGGNGEEFNSIQNSTNLEGEENIAVKVELTEFSVDENGFNVDLCGVKSELAAAKYDDKLLNGSTNLPGSSYEAVTADEDVYIDETFGCETFGDLLENFNKGVLSDLKPFSDDLEATPEHKELTKKKLFSCRFCLYSAFSKPKFQSHMLLNHKSLNLMKKCQLCPYISLERYMIYHEKAHSSKKSFKCKFCWYRSVHKKNATAHHKVHIMGAGQIGKKNKNCIKSKTIKKHELKRKKLLPAYTKHKSCAFQCQYCPYKGKYAANVKAHERIHTGSILKCKLCDFSTFFKSAMTKHRGIHQASPLGLGIKKLVHTCHLCPYSSIRRAAVLRHQKCHVLKKTYKCTKCTYSTAGAKQIRGHELLHSYGEDVKFTLNLS